MASSLVSQSSIDAEMESESDVITPSSHSCQDESKHDDENGDIEACEGVTRPQDTSSDLIKKVLSKISTKSSWKDPGPPPDGGRRAWTQGEDIE